MIIGGRVIEDFIAFWQLRNNFVDFGFRQSIAESEVQWEETRREYQRKCTQPHRMD